jgi:hypothetical protein
LFARRAIGFVAILAAPACASLADLASGAQDAGDAAPPDATAIGVAPDAAPPAVDAGESPDTSDARAAGDAGDAGDSGDARDAADAGDHGDTGDDHDADAAGEAGVPGDAGPSTVGCAGLGTHLFCDDFDKATNAFDGWNGLRPGTGNVTAALDGVATSPPKGLHLAVATTGLYQLLDSFPNDPVATGTYAFDLRVGAGGIVKIAEFNLDVMTSPTTGRSEFYWLYVEPAGSRVTGYLQARLAGHDQIFPFAFDWAVDTWVRVVWTQTVAAGGGPGPLGVVVTVDGATAVTTTIASTLASPTADIVLGVDAMTSADVHFDTVTFDAH